MPLGIVIMLAAAGYRLGSRQYHKRQARRYEYDDLAHDGLGRPLDPMPPHRRLSRNEARALARHRREAGMDTSVLDGDALPDYTTVRRLDVAASLPTWKRKADWQQRRRTRHSDEQVASSSMSAPSPSSSPSSSSSSSSRNNSTVEQHARIDALRVRPQEWGSRSAERTSVAVVIPSYTCELAPAYDSEEDRMRTGFLRDRRTSQVPAVVR